MKVVTKTGLVPVTFHNSGDVVGVPPGLIQGLLERNEATLFPIPDDTETHDVADPVGVDLVVEEAPDAVKKPRKSGGPQGKAKPTAPVAKKPGAKASAEAPAIDIPADWEKLKPLKIISLAGKINRGPINAKGDKEPVDVAKDIIRAEAQRRAGGSKPAGDASSAADDSAKNI